MTPGSKNAMFLSLILGLCGAASNTLAVFFFGIHLTV